MARCPIVLAFFAAHVSALQTGSLRRDEQAELQTVAYCVVGLTRTFPTKKVSESLAHFLDQSGAVGILDQKRPDVFAYLALEDQPSYVNRDAVNNSKEDVLAALDSVGTVVRKELFQNPTDVKNETLPDHVEHLDECFSSGFWKIRHRMVGSINQLLHMQGCVDMIAQEEKKLGRTYDAVVLARPDLIYDEPRHQQDVGHFFDPLKSGIVIHDSDHLFALPRAVAQKLESNGEKLLTCKPGEKCCGKVCQSEDMFEFKLGFTVKYSGSCDCTTESLPVMMKKSWEIYGDYYPGR